MSEVNNKGDVGNQFNDTEFNSSVTFNQVYYAKEQGRRYLTIEPPEPRSYLDRTDLLRYIHSSFTELGQRIFVLHGSSGLGKSTVAKLYWHQYADHYQQVAWIDYRQDIRKSIVRSLRSHAIDQAGTKDDKFYDRVAKSECTYLQNVTDKKRLIVINNVNNWQDMASFLSFLNLKNTDYLITATEAFPPEYWQHFMMKVKNHSLPPLSAEDIQHIFTDRVDAPLTTKLLAGVDGNPYLLDLLIKQAPADNPRVVYDYFTETVGTAKAEVEIALALLTKAQLSAAHCWVLLQLAALPPNTFDADDLSEYLNPADGNADTEDLTNLKGYQHFLNENPALAAPEAVSLTEILAQLTDHGWLEEQGDEEISLPELTRAALKQISAADTTHRWTVTAPAFPELSTSLSQAFFTELSDLLVDDLLYEEHLEAFLDFVPLSGTMLSLDPLWKMISLLEKKGRYYEELALRERHIELVEQQGEVSNLDKVIFYRDLSYCYTRCGYYEKVLSTAKLALEFAQASELGQMVIASCQNSLALAYLDLNRNKEAAELLESVLKIYELQYGIEHYRTAAVLANLGGTYVDLNRSIEAVNHLKKALEIKEKHYGVDHYKTTSCRSLLASCYFSSGKLDKSLELRIQNVRISEQCHGTGHPKTAIEYLNLGVTYFRKGNTEEATPLVHSALAILQKTLGPEHPYTEYAISTLEELERDAKEEE